MQPSTKRSMAGRTPLIAALGAVCVLAACGNDPAEPAASDTTGAASAPSATSAAAGTTTDGAGQAGTVDLYTQTFPVSWQDAVAAARDKYAGDVSKIELEPSDAGRYGYKVEILSDTQKQTIELDAETGAELSSKTDDFDQDKVGSERRKNAIGLEQVIPLQQAMDTARDVHAGPINKWKLEGKSSGPQYEFDITKPGGSGDWEVQIDARDGTVRSTGD
ncbi:PepSY domain-containing protein [Tomitella gaofuii]|uniref:PepSY domain-containing protein n=1 Tax=Tomitella gaofuii TaxID=2760083 RepID=UPI0020C17A59|nr:PepSY domain-containing protein [Tomitella gaofuii]